ncbi:MAG TPA: hypothetical protein VFF79_18360 [Conexibacter sp.]|jgi:hypothetical protein|nr:hypothetical protein [Conexibacter sp.]
MPPPAAAAPRAPIESARAEAADLLVDVEQVRPGLVRNRALALVRDSFTEALGESFDQCDVASSDPAEQLPFADETFDLVYGATLSPGRATEMIREALRVLRLLGVAVVDFASGETPAAEARAPTPRDALQARVAARERLSLVAGKPGELAMTISNTGTTTLGSAVSPLRARASWGGGERALTLAAETTIDAILLPGDSIEVPLEITVPATAGAHLLELSLSSLDPWHERRSQATVVVISVTPRDPSGHQRAVLAAAPRPDESVAVAVAQAGGQVLGVQSVEPGARRRCFFARA